MVRGPLLFEAAHTERTKSSPEDVWAQWADAARWPDWNKQIESAELHGDLEVGTEASVEFKRGGRMRFRVVTLEPGRLFVDEAKLPGCRFGHEHRVERTPGGCEITHRLYLEGPASILFASMFGRKRLRRSVTTYAEREAELTKPAPEAKRAKRRRR
jgi:hypothetical protein